MLRQHQHCPRNGRGDAYRVRQPYDLDGRPEYVSVPASCYIVLRGDLITLRTQPDPTRHPMAAAASQVVDLPRATRQVVAYRVLSQEIGTKRLSVVDKLRIQAPQSGERPIWRPIASKGRWPMTAALKDLS
jgi:hypothetical protein